MQQRRMLLCALHGPSGATCKAGSNLLFTAAAGYRLYTLGAVGPASSFVDGSVMTQ